jgi:hypothetical protein
MLQVCSGKANMQAIGSLTELAMKISRQHCNMMAPGLMITKLENGIYFVNPKI